MTHYIKVHDNNGKEYIIDTDQDTSKLTTEKILSIAASFLQISVSLLRLKSHGRKPPPKNKK